MRRYWLKNLSQRYIDHGRGCEEHQAKNIEIMSRLSSHPNVVDLNAVYEEEDYVHFVMELCAGEELFHLSEEWKIF